MPPFLADVCTNNFGPGSGFLHSEIHYNPGRWEFGGGQLLLYFYVFKYVKSMIPDSIHFLCLNCAACQKNWKVFLLD
jgi:hypothetical protein